MYFEDKVSDNLEGKKHLLHMCVLLKFHPQQLENLGEVFDYKQFHI